MERKINDILKDLHDIPDFKAPGDFSATVSKLVSDKPDTQFNPAFAARLRTQLVAKPAQVAHVSSITSPFATYWSLLTNNSFQSSLAGALIAIIVIAPATFIATRQIYNGDADSETYVKNITSGLSLKQQINNKGMNAFGKLSYLPQAEGGMGGGIAANQNTRSSLNIDSASGTASMSVFPSVASKYTYAGDAIEVKDKEGKVFKRVKNSTAGKQLADFIQKSNFGLVNLPSFSSVGLQNIQLFEDKPFGYSISVNFDEGAIAIYPDYRKWEIKADRAPMPISQIPSDSEFVNVANTFVKDHGVDIAIYGKPIIESRSFTGQGVDGKEQEFAHESVAVTYPLILEGSEVYDESGNMYGLQVMVDTLSKRVTGVNNLTSQVYESSNYTLQTDSKKIITAATSGPQSMVYPIDDLKREIPAGFSQQSAAQKFELQTPKRVLMRHFVYENNKEPVELYVPALLFPVVQQKGVQTYPKNVIVPLITDVLAKSGKASTTATNTVKDISTSTKVLGEVEAATTSPEGEIPEINGF